MVIEVKGSQNVFNKISTGVTVDWWHFTLKTGQKPSNKMAVGG